MTPTAPMEHVSMPAAESVQSGDGGVARARNGAHGDVGRRDPSPHDLLDAERAYAHALHARSGVTVALHRLQSVRAALGLRTHLP